MKTKTTLIIIFVLFAASLAFGFLIAPQMPETIVTHWNAAGEGDGYGSRQGHILFMPLMTLGLSLLILFLPKIDPLRGNIEHFRDDYNRYVVVFAAFMTYIYMLTNLWNLGLKFNMTGMVTAAIGVLFIFTGTLLSKAKRNYFIGIRTPWTLYSDSVWNATHRLGGKLFMASGVIALLALIVPRFAIFLLLVPVLGASLIAVVYSYILFRRETNEKNS
jgi:uncharacterized membrane protein